MIKNIVFISLTIFNFLLRSQNFTATYGFVDVSSTSGTTDPGAGPQVTGLAFGSFNASGVSNNPSASARFSFSDWPLGATNTSDNYENFTGQLSPFAFYKVTIAVLPNYTLSLNSVSFDVRRSGTGIRNYCLRSDADNFTNNLAASTGTNTKLSVLPGDIFFWNYDSISTASDQKGSLINLGNQFSQITNSVSFHFYAWNSESTGGSFSIDNVTFKGSVTDSLSALNAVGLSEKTDFFNLNVFPNPGLDGLYKIKSSAQLISVEVIAVTGESIKVIETIRAVDEMTLSISDLPFGIYFFKIKTSNGTISKRIVFNPS